MLDFYIGFDNNYRSSATWSNGNNWDDRANSIGISVDNYPLPEDIAYWNSMYSGDQWGHVAWVEKVYFDSNGNPTAIDYTQYNIIACSFSEEINVAVGSSNYPDGFIHILAYEEGVTSLHYLDCYEMDTLCDYQTKQEWQWILDRVWDNYRCTNCSSDYNSGYISSIANAISGMGGSPGYETPATDPEDHGLPDFIVKRVELSNYNPGKNDSIKIRAKLKNIGDDDISSDDKIETRFYLSMGYKEDLHSEWKRIGKEYTKGSNLDPEETHWEEETLRLWEYNQIQPGQVYNIVACVDRTKDQDNGDGDYAEEHKSNNCSTEAVFTVANPPPPPAPPPPPQTTSPDGKFTWSYSGPISGMVCVQIIEPADPHTWEDNYFCSNEDYGIQWSCCGPIGNMKNTQIIESADPETWDDNYLAVPNDSLINFSWSSAGPIAGLNCVQWIEPADPHTWDDNYLCYTIDAPPPPPPPPAEYNFSITNLTFSIKDRIKLWPGEAFSVSATAYNSGDNPPSNVQIGYYLDDVLIGTDTISASDFPHGSYRSEALENATAPSEPGDYTARVCVDYNNQIQETDESDNCQSVTIKVEKHLSPAVIQMLFN